MLRHGLFSTKFARVYFLLTLVTQMAWLGFNFLSNNAWWAQIYRKCFHPTTLNLSEQNLYPGGIKPRSFCSFCTACNHFIRYEIASSVDHPNVLLGSRYFSARHISFRPRWTARYRDTDKIHNRANFCRFVAKKLADGDVSSTVNKPINHFSSDLIKLQLGHPSYWAPLLRKYVTGFWWKWSKVLH